MASTATMLTPSSEHESFNDVPTVSDLCRVAQKVIAGVYPGVTTSELDVRLNAAHFVHFLTL
jgi:hypothetical protein